MVPFGRLSFALASSLGAVLLVAATTGAAGHRTGYNVAQAAAGGKAYAANCASCHGARLEGGTGPPLRGALAPFHGTETVGDVYTYAGTQMPLGKPGTLSPATYAAIVAFLMKNNGHPAGARALSARSAASVRDPM